MALGHHHYYSYVFSCRRLKWYAPANHSKAGIIGSAIISFAHLTKSNQGLALLGIYLIPAVNSITVVSCNAAAFLTRTPVFWANRTN